MKDLDQ
jgi:hypothetical protein